MSRLPEALVETGMQQKRKALAVIYVNNALTTQMRPAEAATMRKNGSTYGT